MTSTPTRSTFVRLTGVACLVGAAMMTILATATQVVQASTDVPTDQWSYPWSSGTSITFSLVAAGSQLLLVVGVLGLRRSGVDGTTRTAGLEILSRLVRALRAERLHNYDAVLREYLSAVEASPTNGDLRYGLAVVYHAAKRGQEALQNYQAAMNAPGLEVLGHVGAGIVMMSMGDPGAVRELEEASALVRRAPVPPMQWASRPRLDGEEAVAPDVEIAQLLARAYQQSNPNAMPNYGASRPGVSGSISNPLARGQGGFSDEVYRNVAEITARHPNDPAGTLQEMVQLVKHYRSQRQFEQALVALTEIARIAPEDASVRAEIADIHISRGLLDEGIEELRREIEIFMRHNQVTEAAQVFQQIGEIQWQMGQQDVAMGTLKQVLNLTPDDMGARMLYVQYCLELGMRKEAAEQQTVLARYYYHSRQTKEAVAMLQQLIALDKDNFEAYDLLGQTYFSVGEYDQAQRVYRHLAKINPNSSIARERLAQIQEMRARR